jgi:hypothetical protein
MDAKNLEHFYGLEVDKATVSANRSVDHASSAQTVIRATLSK